MINSYFNCYYNINYLIIFTFSYLWGLFNNGNFRMGYFVDNGEKLNGYGKDSKSE